MTDPGGSKASQGGKKERVLHTRVPAVLEQELKRLANAWRVPVSNLVRAILEDALETIDVVGRKAEGELRSVAELLASERGRLREKSAAQLDKLSDAPEATAPGSENPLQGAVGATPITLVHDAICGITGTAMSAGSEAHLVLFTQPGKQLIVRKDALQDDKSTNAEETHD